jgi:hypothetical protein
VSDHEAADLADRAEAEVAVAEGMPIGGEAD